MKNNVCPNKGSWMCKECNGVCEQCEVGELYPRPTIKEAIKELPAYKMMNYMIIGYSIGLLFIWLMK